jgi:cupin 2 domain-containing protein
MIQAGNIFAGLPAVPALGEEFNEILARPGLRIERIVSTGQASPPGFWYDQPWDEWVLLLSGSAELRLENEAGPRSLGAGDYVFIPARERHRVDWTSCDEPTVWLAVHFQSVT